MKIRKFQEGGAVQAPAAEPTAEQDPMMQLAQVAMAALEQQDCTAALGVCEGLLMMLQGGGQQPAETGQPVFAKGGKILRRK